MKNHKGKLNIKIGLKLWQKNGMAKIYRSSKTRRIIAKVKADNFQKSYLKVSYGKVITNRGKLEEITNEGDYSTKEELLIALSAFTEKSLLDDTKQWINEG